jgi:hypothetical protein
MSEMMRVWIAVALLGACKSGDYLSYDWAPRRVLCSAAIDDLSQEGPTLLVDDEVQYAADAQRVVMFHAHKVGTTVSRGALEHLFDLADRYHLDYVRFDELVPGPKRAGLAFAFDDDYVDTWMGVRDLLQAHHARITFFITRYAMMDPATKAAVDQLAADGHDIEAHTVNHLHANVYVAQHGLDGYMTDEVLPSIQLLRDHGYPVTSFAYPFGEHSGAIDVEILKYVDRVRTTPGPCPN